MSRSPLPENGLEEEEEEDEDLDPEQDASRLESFLRDRRRARSLPAYPLLERDTGGGKRVKFADSMGQTLERVKHFSALDEPRIPSKVLSRHRSFPPPQQHELLNDLRHRMHGSRDADRLLACFPELRDAERRVRQLRVCLERVSVTQFDVRGQIRVLDGREDQEVGVRYTFNDWLSHVDAQAVPVAAEPPEPAGPRFVFTVFTPPFMESGSSVHLAVYLKSDGGEFWDNNGGQNYSFRYQSPSGTAFHAT